MAVSEGEPEALKYRGYFHRGEHVIPTPGRRLVATSGRV